MKRMMLLFVVMLLVAGCLSNAYGQVKLTMGSWRTEDREFYEKVIAAFRQTHPDIEIAYEPTKNTEYNTALNVALQTGSGPDIIHLRPYAPGIQLAEAGYLEPLDGMKGLDQYAESTLAVARAADGKIYGVPAKFSAIQIFYNKKIFAAHNLKEPATWAELLQIAETLQKANVVPFAFGSKDGWLLALTHAALGPTFYGGNQFVEKVLNGETNFKSPEFVKSIQIMKDLAPYFPKMFTGVGMDEMRMLFANEQAAMFIMGDWEIAVVQKQNPNLEFDLFPIPSATGGAPMVTTWVDASYAVNSKSKNKDAALQFVEFLATKEFGKMVADDLHSIPTIPGVEVSDPLIAKILKSALNPETSTPYMIVAYFTQGNPSTKTEFQNLLQGMYLDQLTPEQVADGLQKSTDTWFKPAGK